MQIITVRQFLYQAARLINAVPMGQQMSSVQATDMLYTLNESIDEWNTDGSMIYTEQVITGSLNVGANNGTSTNNGVTVYTIGPGTNASPTTFNVAVRPVNVSFGSFVIPGSQVSYPVHFLTADEWAAIRIKPLVSPLSIYAHIDGQWPVASIYLWPQPSSGGQLVLTTWQALNSALGLDDTIQLPPGYAKGLRHQLAKDFAPSMGMVAPPDIVGTLIAIKEKLAITNIRGDRMTYSGAAQGVRGKSGAYDALTDEFF